MIYSFSIGIEILSGVGMALDEFKYYTPRKVFNRLELLMARMLVFECLLRIFLTFIHTLERPKCEASFQSKTRTTVQQCQALSQTHSRYHFFSTSRGQ